MSVQTVKIHQVFDAPIEQVFKSISDHEKLGKILGSKIKRLRVGQDGANGYGSIRWVKIAFFPSFEETITRYEPNALIEYTITKDNPYKHHMGRMNFTEKDGKTVFDYTVELESKIPFATPLIVKALQSAMTKAFASYALAIK